MNVIIVVHVRTNLCQGAPNENPKATGDAFKTLFVGRLVKILVLLCNSHPLKYSPATAVNVDSANVDFRIMTCLNPSFGVNLKPMGQSSR